MKVVPKKTSEHKNTAPVTIGTTEVNVETVTQVESAAQAATNVEATKVSKPLPAKNKSAADVIWEEVKNVKLELFSLPDQTVTKYFEPKMVDPNKLYLVFRPPVTSAAFPALEEALRQRFSVESGKDFVVVSRL